VGRSVRGPGAAGKDKDKVLGRITSGAAVAVPSTPGRTRTVGFVAGLVVAVLAALALSVAPAWATTAHVVTANFGSPGSNDLGGFPPGSPSAVVVDQASGDLFVIDPAHTDAGGGLAPRVQRFAADGTPEAEFPIDATQYTGPQTIAIDPDNGGALYVGAYDLIGNGVVLKYDLDGTAGGTLTPAADTSFNPAALAVDPSNGEVYVGASDTGTGAQIVEVFDHEGTWLRSLDGRDDEDSPFANVTALAVDGSSRLYVTDVGKTRVDRFSSTGDFELTVVNGNDRGVTVGALAADPTNDELYVVENNSQVEYFSAGGASHLDVFNPFGAFITGVAVNGGDGTDPLDRTVYLADNGQSLGLIATPADGPTVTTTGSSAVGATSATLEGTIDPAGGSNVTYRFEYGLDGVNYGSSTDDTPVSSAGPVSATPTGLLPNSDYHFRIVGTNQETGATVYGGDATFHTDPAPPVVDGAPPFASDIKVDGARINGTVDPRGTMTNYSVEYGTDTTYGSSAPGGQLEGQGDQPAIVDLTGLAPDTEYHYRIVADNGIGGVQHGADATFRTAPATPAGASSVSAVAATLVGTIRLGGHATKYRFEWGDANYGHLTDERDAPGGTGLVTVTDKIDGLTPGTKYHVRVIARDTVTNVTTTGVDGTFTTDPAAIAVTGDVTGVTPTQATFAGDADTHGLAGTYRFYVESSTSTYTSSTEPVTIPPGGGPVTVSGALTDLLPGQTYTVRFTVQSSGYTAFGDAVTFSTPEQPPVLPPPPPPTVADPYGCAAPVLKAYNSHPRPGDAITIAGTDLGVGGTVALGDRTVTPTSWSATSVSIVVPDDAKGSLPLTINCGKASNTIAIQMYQAPSNRFTTPKGKVKGSTATVTLKVPGPGDITVRGAGLKTVKRHVGKAGTYSVKATLSTSGKKSLRRHKRLPRTLHVSFKPNGGTTVTKRVKVTFRR
jgi:hypothetical protein